MSLYCEDMNTTTQPLTRSARRAAQVPDHHGYICKQCHGPSPVGVGYAESAPGAAEASAGLDQCGCGYSMTPELAGASTIVYAV